MCKSRDSFRTGVIVRARCARSFGSFGKQNCVLHLAIASSRANFIILLPLPSLKCIFLNKFAMPYIFFWILRTAITLLLNDISKVIGKVFLPQIGKNSYLDMNTYWLVRYLCWLVWSLRWFVTFICKIIILGTDQKN